MSLGSPTQNIQKQQDQEFNLPFIDTQSQQPKEEQEFNLPFFEGPLEEEKFQPEVETARPKKSKIETVTEIGLPLAGAALGTFIPGLGTLVGSAIGAGIGRGVQEVGELVFKEDEDKKIVPRSFKEAAIGDTVLGNSLRESVTTILGGAAINKFGPIIKKASAPIVEIKRAVY
jgi:hypothetical protein